MAAEIELFQSRPPAQIAAQQLAVTSDAADIDSWVIIASDVIKLASYICETPFVPKAYRNNPHATAAAILAGRELGLPPMTALRHVQVVEGSPSLSAEYKRARVLAAGHELDIIELTITRCKVAGRRRNSGKAPLEITFTIEDARRAGLVKAKGAWETRPRRMLFARAATEVCDFLFADITNGLPTAELVTEGAEGSFEGYDEAPQQESPKPAQRTARRRAADPTPAAATAAAAKPAAGPATAPAAPVDPGMPPLPGEDDQAEAIDKDAPGSVTKPQLTKLGAIFTSYGFTTAEREQRLVTASTIVQRELESSSELSLNEARMLIDTLERCGDRERLMTLLATGEMPEGESEAGE